MSRGDWTTSKLELRAEHGIRGAFYSRRWRRGRAANQGRESQPPAFPSLRFRGVGGVAARRRQTPRPDKKKETPAVCCHAGGRGISDIACPVGRTGGMSPSPTTERKDRGSSSDGTSRWNFLGAQDFFLKKRRNHSSFSWLVPEARELDTERDRGGREIVRVADRHNITYVLNWMSCDNYNFTPGNQIQR